MEKVDSPVVNKGLFHPLFFFLLGLSIYITPVHAEGAIDLSAFPQYLATQLGLSLFAGQLMASAIFISLFLFPCGLLLRKSQNVLFAVLLLLFGCTVAFGWLPFWFLIMAVMGVALAATFKVLERF